MNEPMAALVRRHDPDRFLTALFAPPDKRDALLTLYAFNHELARAREAVSEPPLALVRLHWWREVVEGAPRRHEVADPLRRALDSGALEPADLLAMIDAREAEAEDGFATEAVWRAYLDACAGGLAVAAARLLGAPDPEVLRLPGAAYGVAGILRSVAVHARQGRCLLPHDRLRRHGIVPEQVIRRPEAAKPVVRELADLALGWLRPLRLPRREVAAGLPAVLARRDLHRAPTFPAWRGIGDRLAVVRAGLTGRI